MENENVNLVKYKGHRKIRIRKSDVLPIKDSLSVNNQIIILCISRKLFYENIVLQIQEDSQCRMVNQTIKDQLVVL